MSPLDSLIVKRDEVRHKLDVFLREKEAEEGKWSKTIVNEQGQEESVTDYHVWKNQDKESYDKYAISSENTAQELIHWLEMEIAKHTVAE